ncbi:hypothetical protein BC827DRAFT_1155493 [Russula dissimulans]|nr:hypothetical protein BC827DRAFT_1155493 [Russula dissimulans]
MAKGVEGGPDLRATGRTRDGMVDQFSDDSERLRRTQEGLTQGDKLKRRHTNKEDRVAPASMSRLWDRSDGSMSVRVPLPYNKFTLIKSWRAHTASCFFRYVLDMAWKLPRFFNEADRRMGTLPLPEGGFDKRSGATRMRMESGEHALGEGI